MRRTARVLRAAFRTAKVGIDRLAGGFRASDVSLFHEFQPPPAGGGHQFLRALLLAFRARGVRVEQNTIARTARACLFNSFNFDAARLRRLRRPGCRMVHRVDGPIALYRGADDGTDQKIAALNAEFAEATVFQSRFSLDAHRRLGFSLAAPVVIPNASDPTVFFPPSTPRNVAGRPLRVIASSWSDNPNKGGSVYRDFEALCGSSVQFTFVGRTQIQLQRARVLPPLASAALADELRAHDVYLTASRNDPCSNAVIEALACGLPVVYLRSGGHPELVGNAGLGFDIVEEIPAILARLKEEYPSFAARVQPFNIDEIAARYLAILGLLKSDV